MPSSEPWRHELVHLGSIDLEFRNFYLDPTIGGEGHEFVKKNEKVSNVPCLQRNHVEDAADKIFGRAVAVTLGNRYLGPYFIPLYE